MTTGARPDRPNEAARRDAAISGATTILMALGLFASALVIVRSTTAVSAFEVAGLFLAVGSVPFVWTRNRPLRWLVIAMVGWCAAIVVSDQVHGTESRQTISALAFPLLITLFMLTVPFLSSGRPGRIKALLFAGVAAHLAYVVIYPGAVFAVQPWKFGLAGPVIVLTLMALTPLSGRTAPVLTLIGFALYSAQVAQFRSMAGICLAAAFVLVFQGRAARAAGRYSTRRLIAVGLIGGAFVLSAYSWAAGSGHLGYEAQAKYVRETASGDLFLAGRPELIPASVAIEHSPLLGLGSDGNLTGYHKAEAVKRMIAVSADTSPANLDRIFGQDALNTHSIAMSAWSLSGILGFTPWLLTILLALRGIARGPAGGRWQPVVTFWGILTIWNSLFSPHELHEQFMVGGLLVLVTMADWRQPDSGGDGATPARP